jgi:hypothetical protein
MAMILNTNLLDNSCHSLPVDESVTSLENIRLGAHGHKNRNEK